MAKITTSLKAACRETRCIIATLISIISVGLITLLITITCHRQEEWHSPASVFIVEHKMMCAAVLLIWFAVMMVLIWRRPIEQIVKS